MNGLTQNKVNPLSQRCSDGWRFGDATLEWPKELDGGHNNNYSDNNGKFYFLKLLARIFQTHIKVKTGIINSHIFITQIQQNSKD